MLTIYAYTIFITKDKNILLSKKKKKDKIHYKIELFLYM